MSIHGIHHIVLFCSDTEASKAWYENVGFEYLRGYGGMYWLSAGPTEIMLHPGGGNPGAFSPHLHAGTADVDRLFAHVVDLGFTPIDHQQEQSRITEPVTRPWGDREFELEDPDGYRWIFTEE